MERKGVGGLKKGHMGTLKSREVAKGVDGGEGWETRCEKEEVEAPWGERRRGKCGKMGKRRIERGK